jgi:osmotically-inducible protein OsmY
MWNKDEVKGNARRKVGEMIEKVGKVITGSAVTGFLALTLLGISASLNGCSAASSPQATGSSTPQAQISNAALEEKIKTNLNTDAQLKAANLDVKANVDRNEVLLSGTVESEAAKTKAIESAKSAQAGLSVTSKINVDSSCCGSEGAHGRKEGMPGMKGMPGKEHKPQ